jgi:hypothetical protein
MHVYAQCVPTNDNQSAPNAWRILDSYGDHRYTVYTLAEAQALCAANEGWTFVAVRIKSPRW